jgi:hypothetical protein
LFLYVLCRFRFLVAVSRVGAVIICFRHSTTPSNTTGHSQRNSSNCPLHSRHCRSASAFYSQLGRLLPNLSVMFTSIQTALVPRHGGSRRISPSCRSCCPASDDEKPQFGPERESIHYAETAKPPGLGQ